MIRSFDNCGLEKWILYLFAIICLFILSGCGDGMSAEIVSSQDSGGESTQNTGEVNGEDSGEVNAGGNSEVTPVDYIKLSWLAPESNADGSTLTDLGGYMVYYRMDNDAEQIYSLDVGNVTSVTIENLSPGIWCFAIKAYKDSNIESKFSNYACKNI